MAEQVINDLVLDNSVKNKESATIMLKKYGSERNFEI